MIRKQTVEEEEAATEATNWSAAALLLAAGAVDGRTNSIIEETAIAALSWNELKREAVAAGLTTAPSSPLPAE